VDQARKEGLQKQLDFAEADAERKIQRAQMLQPTKVQQADAAHKAQRSQQSSRGSIEAHCSTTQQPQQHSEMGNLPHQYRVWDHSNGSVKTLEDFQREMRGSGQEGPSSTTSYEPRAVTYQNRQAAACHTPHSAQPAAAASNIPAGCTKAWFESVLTEIVGMDELKDQLRALRREVVLDQKRRKAGHDIPQVGLANYHMVFKGNPGTGKTTVGRLIASMLHSAGVMQTNKLVEANRCSLVGEYVGQTAPKTRSKIDEARGGVLFVDEAYRLSAPSSSGRQDFGSEAIEELQQAMDEDDCPLMIFAGYPAEMDDFISTNAGLFRRITYPQILFPNHTVDGLAQILQRQVEKHGFELSLSSGEISTVLAEHVSLAQLSSMNGGIGAKVFQLAKHSLNSRVDEEDDDPSVTLCLEDIVQGCKGLPIPIEQKRAIQPKGIDSAVSFMIPQPC